MKVTDLVAKMKAAHPSLFEGKNREKLAETIIRNAFGVIRQELEQTEAGAVVVGGLGSFKVRSVERPNQEGQVEGRRLVTFTVQKRRVKAKQPS